MSIFLYHIEFFITDEEFNICILLSQDELTIPVYIKSYDKKLLSNSKIFKMVYNEFKEYLNYTNIVISKENLLLLDEKLKEFNLQIPKLMSIKIENQEINLSDYEKELTPKEILFLIFIDGKEINDKSIKNWEEEHHLNVTLLINSLLEADYITLNNYQYNLIKAKRPLLLEVVEKFHLDIRGDNQDLIKKIKSDLTDEQLEAHFCGTHYTLTEKGKEIAKKNTRLDDFNKSSFHYVDNMRNEEFYLMSLKKLDYNFQAISRLLLPKANVTLIKYMNWDEFIESVKNPPKVQVIEPKVETEKKVELEEKTIDDKKINHYINQNYELSNLLSKVRTNFIHEQLNQTPNEVVKSVDDNPETKTKSSFIKNKPQINQVLDQTNLNKPKEEKQPTNTLNPIGNKVIHQIRQNDQEKWINTTTYENENNQIREEKFNIKCDQLSQKKESGVNKESDISKEINQQTSPNPGVNSELKLEENDDPKINEKDEQYTRRYYNDLYRKNHRSYNDSTVISQIKDRDVKSDISDSLKAKYGIYNTPTANFTNNTKKVETVQIKSDKNKELVDEIEPQVIKSVKIDTVFKPLNKEESKVIVENKPKEVLKTEDLTQVEPTPITQVLIDFEENYKINDSIKEYERRKAYYEKNKSLEHSIEEHVEPKKKTKKSKKFVLRIIGMILLIIVIIWFYKNR